MGRVKESGIMVMKVGLGVIGGVLGVVVRRGEVSIGGMMGFMWVLGMGRGKGMVVMSD